MSGDSVSMSVSWNAALTVERSLAESCPVGFQVTALVELLTHACASITKQYNSVPASGW